MTIVREYCPHCGQLHEINIPLTVSRCRATRQRGANGFEYSLTMPEKTLLQDAALEITFGQEILLHSLAGGGIGLAGGFGLITLVPAVAFPVLPISFCLGSSFGILFLNSWLKVQRDKAIPFVRSLAQQVQAGNERARLELPQPQKIELVNITNNERQHKRYEFLGVLPVDLKRFTEWAREVVDGSSLAINKWSGSNAIFSRSEYEDLLSHLQRFPPGKPMVTNSGGKGNKLTALGERKLREHLARYPTLKFGVQD